MIGHRQRVSQPENWLTDMAEENRQFVKVIYLPEGINWTEVTDAEKVTWNMDFSKDIDLSDWNPTDKGTTFLQNFKEHIALRLTDQGSGLTLTLHRDVVDAIDAAEATYGIRHIICNQKGWTISPAPTA